jgi:DNA polymerase-1
MNFRKLEEAMMADLLDHRDIHKRRAAKIFDIPYDEVTDEQRRIAKAIGFGVLYGMSNYRMSQVIPFQQMPKDKEV